MPKVTCIVSTFRPGGIDITLAGMRDQKFRDFELIIVDRRFELRHDRVVRLAREYGVPMVHVPEHRRNSHWTSFCSAWNTGMALAKGDVLILLQDWAYCPPGFIEAHVEAVGEARRYVLAPYVYTQMPHVHAQVPFDFAHQMDRGGHCLEPDAVLSGGVFDEISVFSGGLFDPKWLRGHEMARLPYPHQDSRAAPRGSLKIDNWVHVKNESILRSVAWELNGLDERLERGKGPMDTDWGNRLVEAGVELWWEPSALSFSPNPRVLCRTMPWGDMEERLHGRWSYRDGERYCERRVNEIRAGGSPAAKNTYTLEELGTKLEKWRSGVLQPPPLDCDDLTYFGRDIQWDTP